MAIGISNPNGKEKNDILYFHATIKSGETKVRITCLDTSQDIEDMKVSIEDLPTYPKFVKGMVIEDCSVIYDKTEDKVLAINPWNGIFEAIGTDIGPRPEEGAEPVADVKEKTGQDGKPYIDRPFYEVFKITDKNEYDGFFYGTTPRLFLKDKFYERDDGMTDIQGTEKSRWTVRLQKMVMEQGLGDEDIPWPQEDGNVLPILLERLQENERPVRLVFENGWINSLTSIGGRRKVEENPFGSDEDDVDEEFPVPDEEDSAPVKQPAKKEVKATSVKTHAKKVPGKRAKDEDDDL